MAFLENPIIDESSKYSDKSEWRFKEHFSQSNGFICRTDVPDKGCDFDIELIVQGASNWRFPVQLKSIGEMQLVNNEQFVSYPLETSRLGYLMRRIPAMGIVALYSVKNDKCYFDYTDKIYQRLMYERETDEWKNNNKVNIRVPILNELTESVVAEIHEVMKKRFEQAIIMQKSYGEKYGLPTEGLSNKFKYDFNNVEDIKLFLSEYGIFLVNNYDLGIVYSMIAKIPNAAIYSNKELLLIAAVSFSECGMYSDSELFLSKIYTKQIVLSDNEMLMLKFVGLKNKLALGYLPTQLFITELTKLKSDYNDPHNQMTLEINLIKFELLQIKGLEQIPQHLLPAIEAIFEKIKKSNFEIRTKGLFTIWNCQNLSRYLALLTSKNLGDLRIKESLGDKMSDNERKKAAIEMLILEQTLDNTLQEVNQQASISDDKLLKAYSILTHTEHFLQQQVNYLTFETNVSQISGYDSRLKDEISFALTAYNYFNKLSLNKEVYDSLCHSIEISELAEIGYGIKAYPNKDFLYQTKHKIETELGFEPKPIAMIDLLNKLKRNKTNKSDGGGMHSLKYLNDAQIETLAKIVIKSFELSESKLDNVINEMKAYRLFHQRCSDENITVFQFNDYFKPKKDSYNMPIRFVLRNKKTSLETPPSADMNKLLLSWGY